ncbi:hypothetical protein FRC04_003962 [Tulasnella sp. 424]|nr:hypothetical protein FRC04_003962 [Tulasnella sp. 424]KAG8965198.1 hypothetical protein FRC05_003341 [Tulasnella sp. 425]
MERGILISAAPRIRVPQALYAPNVIYIDPNDLNKDTSPLAVLIVLAVFNGILLCVLLLLLVEMWKRRTGRRPMFRIPGIDYVDPETGEDNERLSIPLRPPSSIPPTPTVIPPTPPPPIHLGGPTRIDEIDPQPIRAVNNVLSPQGFVRSNGSSDSLDSGLGEVLHGRRVSLSLAPASLQSSTPSIDGPHSGNNVLPNLRAKAGAAVDFVEANPASGQNRDTGDFTILVSPPTPSSTSHSCSTRAPISTSLQSPESVDTPLGHTTRQVNSRHTLLLNDLNQNVGEHVATYQRACYDEPEDLLTPTTSQLPGIPSVFQARGDHTDNSLAPPHRHDYILLQRERLPSLEDRYDPENTNPFRKSSPRVPPIALHYPGRGTNIPTSSLGRKDISMNRLVQHMMTSPTSSASQLSIPHSGTALRSYFSPTSAIVPLPTLEEESFLARSTAAVKKVWKSAFGLRLVRKAGSEVRVGDEVLGGSTQLEEEVQRPIRAISAPKPLLPEAPNYAYSQSHEDQPSLGHPRHDIQLPLSPSRETLQGTSQRSPMADTSNLSRLRTPGIKAEDANKMKPVTPQSPRTSPKVYHHSRVSSSPFFLQASPRVVSMHQPETLAAVNDPPLEETPNHEHTDGGLSEKNGSPSCLSSTFSDDRHLSMLLSSAGLSAFPSPPLGLAFPDRQRDASEFTLDHDYHLSEPPRVSHGRPIELPPAQQETSIYDEWNSYLPTTPASLENMDQRLLDRSLLSIRSPNKRTKLSDGPFSARAEEDEDGEVVDSMRADRDDRVRLSVPLRSAFTPSQTSTPVKSAGRQNHPGVW